MIENEEHEQYILLEGEKLENFKAFQSAHEYGQAYDIDVHSLKPTTPEAAILLLEKWSYNMDEVMFMVSEFWDNKEFMTEAIKIYPEISEHISGTLESDEKFFEEILSSSPYVVAYLKKYYNNLEVAKELCSKRPHLVKFFSDDVIKDKELANIVLSADPSQIIYFPDEVYENENFFKECGLDKEIEDEVKDNIEYIKENMIGGAIYNYDYEAYLICRPVEVKTFAKTAIVYEDSTERMPTLNSTLHEGDVYASGNDYFDDNGNLCGYASILVYSGDLSIEQNLKLISAWGEFAPMGYSSFLEYHKEDLIKCIGEDNYNKLGKVYSLEDVEEGIEPTKTGMSEIIEEMVGKEEIKKKDIGDLA